MLDNRGGRMGEESIGSLSIDTAGNCEARQISLGIGTAGVQMGTQALLDIDTAGVKTGTRETFRIDTAGWWGKVKSTSI